MASTRTAGRWLNLSGDPFPDAAAARYHPCMKSRRMKIPRLAIAAAACLMFLAACGNKGPLFMPQQPAPVVDPLPPPEPVEPTPTDATPVDSTPAEPVPEPTTQSGDGIPH